MSKPNLKHTTKITLMAQTLVKNFVHIVFSTKNREPLIYPPYEGKLHAYLGSICMDMECQVIVIGGYTDHVHILCNISKKIALMTLVQKLKANSSRWIKTIDLNSAGFKWQDGYGSFSINYNEIDSVAKYIKNQHEHHQKTSFKEEYLSLLAKDDIQYDERYVWD